MKRLLYIAGAVAASLGFVQPALGQAFLDYGQPYSHTGNGFWYRDPWTQQQRYTTYDRFQRTVESSGGQAQRFTRQHQNVSISVSESKDPVHAGDALTYFITLGNPYESTANVDVRAYLDPHTDFRYASNDGKRTGDRVFWGNLVLYGHTTRTISVTVRVDTTVTDRQTLTFRALAGQYSATETTTVDDGARRAPLAPPSPVYHRSAPASSVSRVLVTQQVIAYAPDAAYGTAHAPADPADDFQVTLRKRKDGLNDVIYTLTVENHTNRTFRDVDVTHLFSFPVERIRFLSTGGGRDKGDRVSWSLGNLAPYEYRVLTLHARFTPGFEEGSDAVRSSVEAVSRDPALLARSADTVHIGRGTAYVYNYDAVAFPQAGVIDYVFARDEQNDRYLFKPASSPEKTPFWLFACVFLCFVAASIGAARVNSRR